MKEKLELLAILVLFGFCLVAESAMEAWGVMKFCCLAVGVLTLVWGLIGLGRWMGSGSHRTKEDAWKRET